MSANLAAFYIVAALFLLGIYLFPKAFPYIVVFLLLNVISRLRQP